MKNIVYVIAVKNVENATTESEKLTALLAWAKMESKVFYLIDEEK